MIRRPPRSTRTYSLFPDTLSSDLVDWRGFRLPWIYTGDDDLFIRPAPPPSADSLSLEPWIVEDNWGEEIELERPTALPLDDEAQAELARFNNGAWEQLQAARATSLFETPVEHFLVRAFLADGMDEVMEIGRAHV